MAGTRNIEGDLVKFGGKYAHKARQYNAAKKASGKASPPVFPGKSPNGAAGKSKKNMNGY